MRKHDPDLGIINSMKMEAITLDIETDLYEEAKEND